MLTAIETRNFIVKDLLPLLLKSRTLPAIAAYCGSKSIFLVTEKYFEILITNYGTE